MFCDKGIDPITSMISGKNPILFSAEQNLHLICMYLLLRTKNINIENPKTGHNVFVTYMLREDKHHMGIVLVRGADINYVNQLE